MSDQHSTDRFSTSDSISSNGAQRSTQPTVDSTANDRPPEDEMNLVQRAVRWKPEVSLGVALAVGVVCGILIKRR